MATVDARVGSSHHAATGWGRWLWLAVAVVIADQLTKALILGSIAERQEIVVTGFFSLILAFNTGAAFSFLAGAGGWQRWFFIGIALAACALLVWMLRRGGSRLLQVALALILGGAVGNVWDRIVLGKVVDFLLFHYQGWAWPAFNVADSAITVGAALLIVDSFRPRPAGAVSMAASAVSPAASSTKPRDPA